MQDGAQGPLPSPRTLPPSARRLSSLVAPLPVPRWLPQLRASQPNLQRAYRRSVRVRGQREETFVTRPHLIGPRLGPSQAEGGTMLVVFSGHKHCLQPAAVGSRWTPDRGRVPWRRKGVSTLALQRS